MSVDVDGARLRGLSVGGWLLLGLATVGIALVGQGVVRFVSGSGGAFAPALLGGMLALVGFAGAYENACPEYEGRCACCGRYICTDSSRDGVDEYIKAYATGTPRRLTVGPFSMVLSRTTDKRYYCSGACADSDVRILLGESGIDPSETSTGEVSET